MIEDVCLFGTPALAGVLCSPTHANGTGVVLLSPGLLHRVGPNRLYVKLARALAAEGFSVLRFDFSGQGESAQRTDLISVEQRVIGEVQAAIDHLIVSSGCSRVLLMGHCSGAFISLMTASTDPRVTGVVAISPEGGDDSWVEFDRRQKEARYYANYYGRAAMTDSGRWQRLLTGRADYRSIARNVLRGVIWYRISAMAYQLRNARSTTSGASDERSDIQAFKESLRILSERQLPILLIHPDQSRGPELLRALLGDMIEEMHEDGHLQVANIAESDHMFTPLAAQRELIETICAWVRPSEVVVEDVIAAGVAS